MEANGDDDDDDESEERLNISANVRFVLPAEDEVDGCIGNVEGKMNYRVRMVRRGRVAKGIGFERIMEEGGRREGGEGEEEVQPRCGGKEEEVVDIIGIRSIIPWE